MMFLRGQSLVNKLLFIFFILSNDWLAFIFRATYSQIQFKETIKHTENVKNDEL